MIIQIRNLSILLVTIAAVYVILDSFLSYGFILKTGLFLLAIQIGDALVKLLWNSLDSRPLKHLEEKCVLITGCDTGFGNKLAKQLDKKGVEVFACCLFAKGKDAIQLKEECSQNLHIVQLDVTSDDQVKAAVATVKNKLSGRKLWAIVNNSGIAIGCEAVLTSIESYRKTMDINTLGVVRVTKAFIPMLKESKGRIVNVESFAGIISGPAMASYCMSKHALVSFSETLRSELAKFSITVHSIRPMFYSTPITDTETLQRGSYKEWEQAPEELKNLYGPDYSNIVQKALNFLSKSPIKPKANLQEVIDCMIDAAIGKYPKIEYFPGLVAKSLLWLFYRCPAEILDLLGILYMRYLHDKR